MKTIIHLASFLVISCLLASGTVSYAARYSIDVKNYTFSPSELPAVNIGDTIHWEWKNGSHTTTSTTIPSGAAAWDKPIDASHTSYDYIPTLAGTYHYKCTPHAGMGMVGQFTVLAATGMKESARVPEISVYPNPFRDKVYFKNVAQQGVFIRKLTVYDAGGKAVRELSFRDGSPFPGSLDLSDIPEGLVLFDLTDNLDRHSVLRAVRKD